MSQFSGRMTDSRGLVKTSDPGGKSVSKTPHQVLGTPKGDRHNKGVMAARRDQKRLEAEIRQEAYAELNGDAREADRLAREKLASQAHVGHPSREFDWL